MGIGVQESRFTRVAMTLTHYQTRFCDQKLKKKRFFEYPPPFPIPHFQVQDLHEGQLISGFRRCQSHMSGSMGFPWYRDNTPIGLLSDCGPGIMFYTYSYDPNSLPNTILRPKIEKKTIFRISPPL